ncbi:MATE family efflux transporter [Spartinivicinus poritis]|uniref:MATE family efflux transporter n=1 Tax=Spartinivicinus poritis TaxID=2994640 RepID=A0ABT5UDW8_9GAMM|nr:MATE family efflux transporter [Spartinivicinus sp. A2-2]MDE1464206.1 MATE family efflux transporter [Spartinivicinus sp. A2-2]
MSNIHVSVWAIAWPMMLANITTPLLGLVDAAVLGHLPEAYYLGAVAIGSAIFSFIFWSFGFLRMGTTGVVAQAFGENNYTAIHRYFCQSIIIALVIGTVVISCQSIILWLGRLFFAPPAQVLDELNIYYGIRIWSAPAVLINFTMIGWLIGVQRTRVPLLLTVIAHSTNIVLDILLVMVFKLNTAGVAFATVTADYLTLIIGLICCNNVLRNLGQPLFVSINLQGIKQLLLINKDLFFRSLCLLLCFAFFTAQGSRQGEQILAANALLINFLLIISNGLDGFAHAAEALVGKAIGEKNLDYLRLAIKSTGIWSVVGSVCFMLLFWLFGKQIIFSLTDIESVRELAITYLPWLIWLPLVTVWSYWLDGVFIGTVRTDLMMYTVLASSLFIYLPVWWFTRQLDNTGLWFAFFSFLSARSLFAALGFYYMNKKQAWIRAC